MAGDLIVEFINAARAVRRCEENLARARSDAAAAEEKRDEAIALSGDDAYNAVKSWAWAAGVVETAHAELEEFKKRREGAERALLDMVRQLQDEGT